MQHLFNYNDYLLNETINWFDNELLLIKESKSSNKLSNIWKNLLDKAKKLNKNNKTKLYSYTLGSLLALYSYGELKQIIGNDDPEAIEVLNNLKLNDEIIDETPDINDYYDEIKKRSSNSNEIIEDSEDEKETKPEVKEDSKEYNSPLYMKVSPKGRKMIKWHEGSAKQKGEPVLTAYKLGDGMITIGWGHAEPKRKSKFKTGQKITREKAQELFQKDLQFNADAIRRIFKNWEEKGINVELTQDQFDALVSLSFNAGIGNVRMSNFIQSIKKNDFKKAGEQILNFKISNKFDGLAERRKDEARPFLNQ